MKDTIPESKDLLPWYDTMISSAAYMILFSLLSILAFPLLLIYGALLPLFQRRRCAESDEMLHK
ncbi:MAG: hypothetical protein EOM15_03240 [Spirochaetia bacterium]|nr:hypothetical protein [Spirochaetia bacterium]